MNRNNPLISTLFIFCFVLLFGCIEPFYFELEEDSPPLVIQSYVSDVSYDESLLYPSDGRFFTTTLRYGQNLFGKGINVSGAEVLLHSDKGEFWSYSENRPGEYLLTDPQFAAIKGNKYKLEITLPTSEKYESTWEEIYSGEHAMGDLGFVETTVFNNRFDRGEEILQEISGVELTVEVPNNTTSNKRFYMWEYESAWIFIAGRLDFEDPLYDCFVRSTSYLQGFDLTEDNSGGYTENLAFVRVEANERVLYDMSILVKQFIISQEYYNFLIELGKQTESNNIFATPPFNLKTNYKGINTDYPVFGYFSVRDEEAKRMYFSVDDLSYVVDTTILIQNCRTAEPPYAPDDPCDNCLNYSYGGEASLDTPRWWVRR